jgi:hypothetical protein
VPHSLSRPCGRNTKRVWSDDEMSGRGKAIFEWLGILGLMACAGCPISRVLCEKWAPVAAGCPHPGALRKVW